MKENRGTSRTLSVRETVLVWIPTIVVIILILVMATRPLPKLLRIRHIDKYVHAAEYCVLAFLSFRSLQRSRVTFPLMKTAFLALVVGIADETIQARGTMRTADLMDLVADMIGALLGSLLAFRLMQPLFKGRR
jgi:VanZ family protein